MAAPMPIKCKSCERILATISPDGLVPAEGPDALGCDTCQQFSALFNAMRAADEEYAPLDKKGDRHRGKQDAVEKVKKTHMDFDNWLISVEAPVQQDAEQQDDSNADGQGEDEVLKDEVEEQQRSKRARSYSPTTHPIGGDDPHNGAQENEHPQQQQQTLLIPHRPSPKRSRSTASLPERKRLKFSDSVKFRDDYRSYLSLSRSNEDYVPGRYAPPDGGYLDTSGSGQTFLKFTGLKKVRGTWVEVKEQDDESKSKGTKKATEKGELGDSDGAVTKDLMNDLGDGGTSDDKTELDSRSVRLARRTRRYSSMETAQQHDDAVSTVSATARRRRDMSPDRASNEVSKAIGDGAAMLSTPEVEGHDDQPVEAAGIVAHDLGTSKQILDIGAGQDNELSPTEGVTCNEEANGKQMSGQD
ncbi:hypothetical protein N0V83_002683 [Neocucurbitaria cava]|uniref:Uncharacterized protein n=1 Tax=Neocucurbitaria cava TaxID=798079 RepID=A0A9W8YCM2_9PLEO|nr:hypothetical protein N0V83_002683 [Neocucurbitaria cava]